jgi:hypothetical protein
VRLSIHDPVRLMYLRPESCAKFDTCTYPASFWISNVLGFATDDAVIPPFGVAISLVLPLLAMGCDSPPFHKSRSGSCEINFTDAYIKSLLTGDRPERDL